jgi:hypothetical protein
VGGCRPGRACADDDDVGVLAGAALGRHVASLCL